MPRPRCHRAPAACAALPACAEEIKNGVPTSEEQILTPDARAFLEALSRRFESSRRAMLHRRVLRQKELDAGELPRFLPETEDVRKSSWVVAPIPPELEDRRVEITGPTDRKMIINALNSGANVFMADLEDA